MNWCPEEYANQCEGGKESVCELIVAGGESAVLLELVEEALDEIALTVEGEIGFARLAAIGFRGDDGRDATLLERLDQRVGVIALIGENGFGLDLVEQRHRLCDIGRLARRERQRHGVAERIDDGVDLGRQSATGSADGLIFAFFFLAPALCWWARTLVESMDMYSASASNAKALRRRAKTPLLHHLRKRLCVAFQSP